MYITPYKTLTLVLFESLLLVTMVKLLYGTLVTDQKFVS